MFWPRQASRSRPPHRDRAASQSRTMAHDSGCSVRRDTLLDRPRCKNAHHAPAQAGPVGLLDGRYYTTQPRHHPGSVDRSGPPGGRCSQNVYIGSSWRKIKITPNGTPSSSEPSLRNCSQIRESKIEWLAPWPTVARQQLSPHPTNRSVWTKLTIVVSHARNALHANWHAPIFTNSASIIAKRSFRSFRMRSPFHSTNAHSSSRSHTHQKLTIEVGGPYIFHCLTPFRRSGKSTPTAQEASVSLTGRGGDSPSTTPARRPKRMTF